MDSNEVREKIRQGESLHCEFKLAARKLPASFFETVCAFLNTDGGTIYLGVSDNREIEGISDEVAVQICSDIASQSNNPQKLDPPFLLFPQTIEIASKLIIAVNVPISSQVHRANGEIFLRSQDGDFKMRGTHQLAGLVNRKLSLFSEQRVVKGIKSTDLETALFDKARKLMRSINRNHPWAILNEEELLKIGGFSGRSFEPPAEGLNYAAILMFGSEELIQSVLPGYKFDCLLRRDNQERYDDRLTIRCNLIDAYDLMMGFVEKHLNDPFYLENGLRVSLRERFFAS